MGDITELKNKLADAIGRERVDILIELGRELYLADPDQADIYVSEAHQLATVLDYKKGIAAYLRVRGNLFWVKGDYDNAMAHYDSSRKQYESLDDRENLTLVYKAIARTHWNLGDIVNSLRYYHLALETAEDIDNKPIIASCCNGLGFVYYHKRDYNKALTYFQKSLLINEAIGETRETAISYNNIADICLKMGNADQALEFALKANELLKEIEKDNAGYSCEFNITIGDAYLAKDETEKAFTYYNKALETATGIDYKEGMMLSGMKIGRMYLKKGERDNALKYLENAYTLASETGNKQEESELREMLERSRAANIQSEISG